MDKKIKAPVSGAGHRMRLRRKLADGKLTDSEVLELLLTYAIPRRDVKQISRALFARFGGVHKILTAPMDELREVPGIGDATAAFIKAIREIILLNYKNYLNETPLFHNAKRLEDYCRLELMEKKTEEFHVLYLDRDRRLIENEKHASGTIDNVAVYPREILRRALDPSARFVVLAHNHPDGCRSFSAKDLELTEEIRNILSVVNIDVVDHMLVSDGLVFSMAGAGWLRPLAGNVLDKSEMDLAK